MKLSKDIKDKINNEYTSWKENMYAGKTVEERQAMGQFFTPPEISIRMLENFPDTNGTILDPTMGAANLLVVAYFAGFKIENIYGIELDKKIFDVAKTRLMLLGFPESYFMKGKDNHFFIGDALQNNSYDFPFHKGKLGKFIK
jgi:type I restriction-modification system DNA methylase subunit